MDQHGRTVEDALRVTLYPAAIDAYEQVNETCEQSVEEDVSRENNGRRSELFGGVPVTPDAVVALE